MVSFAVSGINVDINNPWYSCQSMMLSLENLDVWEWILQTFYPNVLLCDAVVNRNVNLLHVVVQSFIFRIQVGELLMLVLTVRIKSRYKIFKIKRTFFRKSWVSQIFLLKEITNTDFWELLYTEIKRQKPGHLLCQKLKW